MANYPKEESSEDSTGVTAVDADGNPIVLDEGAVEGEGAGEQADASAEGEEPWLRASMRALKVLKMLPRPRDEAAADAEGAAPAGARRRAADRSAARGHPACGDSAQ